MIRSYPAKLLRTRRTRLIAAASAGVIVWSLASAASALPTGGIVYDPSGSGLGTTITPGAGVLTVDQGGERVVIDWTTFNIGTGESVTFNQPDANAIAFNRVDPSAFTTIDGTLAGNGGVWLFSPGGLLFGANAQVNVGSFVGSTAQLQDADIAAALSGDTVTLSPLAANAASTLTVTAGADLTATNGFMVLQGETIVQNGNVVSNTDAVWFGVAEGATVTMDTSGSAPVLTDATVQAVAGRGKPSFTQGSAALSQAQSWFGISTPGAVESGWQTVMNLDGTIRANGIKPGTTQGVVIITGENGVVDETAGDVVIDAAPGFIDSDYDIYIAGGAVTLGQVQSDHSQIDILADSLIEITDLFGTPYSDVTLTTTGAGSLIDIQAYMYASTVTADSAGDLQVDSGAKINARSYVLTNYGDTSIHLSAVDDLTIAVGAQVDGKWDVYLDTSGVDSELTVGGFVRGGGALGIDGSYNVTILGAADLLGYATTVNSIKITAGNDLEVNDNADVIAYDNATLTATGGDLTVAGDVYGDFVGVYSGDAMTIASTALFQVNQFHGVAGGDAQVDGIIDAPTTLFITSTGGDIALGATADLSSFSVGLTAADHLSTAAGSNIDGNGGVGTLSLWAYGSDGVDDAMVLAGDITGHNIQLLTTAGSITLADGTITADNALNVYDQGGDLTVANDIDANGINFYVAGDFIQTGGTITVDVGGLYAAVDGNIRTDAGALIQAAPDADSAIIYLDAFYDVHLAGDIHGGYLVNILSEGTGGDTMLEVSGTIYASDLVELYNDRGDIHLTSTAELYTGTPTQLTDPEIFIAAEGSIAIDAGAYLHTPGAYSGAAVEIYANDVVGSVYVAGDIASTNVTIGSRFGDVDVTIGGGTIDASGIAYIYSTGDLIVQDGATINAAYAQLMVDGPDNNVLRVDGDINTSETIWLYNYVGDVEIGSNATLHGNTDASPDNGGPLGFQTDTIEIRGENITAEDGSRIIVGDAGDSYRGTISIISDDIDNNLPTNVSLDGYIKAEAVDVTVADGSLDLSGALYTTGALAFDVSGLVTMDYTGYLGADGYLNITAGDGIDLNGVVRVDGDINLTTLNADADINIKGDIYAYGGIELNSSADINLYTGGALQADADTYGGDGSIGLYADGAVTTQTGSNLIVGNTGYRTGDVIISAGGTGEPIDLSGNIYAQGLGLIAAYGSIHLRDGDIYVDDSLAINSAYDFTMDASAAIHSGGDIDITAQYTLDAEGHIYADGDVSFYKYGANAGDLTVGGLVHADGGVSIINAGDGDVIIDGDFIADADGGGGSSGIYISSQDQVIGLSGLLQVGSDVYNTTGYITIAAAGADTVDYSAIDLNLDIIADGVSINPVAGSLHFAGGDIHLDNMTVGSATADVVIDSGVTVDVTGDVTISAPGEVILNGDITAGGGIYAVRLNSGDHDLYIGGDLTSDGGVRLVNAGDGDVIINGDVIADADGISSPGYIYVSSQGSVIGGDGGLLQVGSAPDSVTGDVTIFAHGYDGAFDAIDLSLDIYANALFLNTENGSIHLGDGKVYTVQSLYLDSNFDILIDGAAYITSGGDIEATAAGDVTIGDGADVETSQVVTLESTGGDITVDGYVRGGGVYVYGYGAVSVGDTGTLRSTLGLVIDTDGYAGAAIDIDGVVRSNGPLTITNDYGGIDVGPNGYVRGGTSQNGVSVVLSSYGDLTLEDGSEVSGPNDVQLETTGAGAALTIGGDVYGNNIHVAGSGDITLTDTGYLFTYGLVDIESYSATPTAADITIDGDIVGVGGISIANRNNGDVSLGSGALLSTYYYYYCADCRTSGGTALMGLDGDIYLYSAGQVVTAAGSMIDATGGTGSDAGLLTIVAKGGDNATTSAVDLSGDINAYNVSISADTGSVRLRDGEIYVTDNFFAGADGNFDQDAASSITGLAYINIDAHADIHIAGSMYGYYIDINTDGTSVGGNSIIDISGYIYATDEISISNDGGDVNVAAGGELYVGVPYENSNPAIYIDATGEISTEAGSYIHTYAGDAGGYIRLRSQSDTGNAIDLAGDIYSGDVRVMVNGYGALQITDGTIEALGDIYVSSYGQVHITGGTLDAAETVYLTAGDDMLLAGDIYAGSVAAHIYGGEAAYVPGASIEIDGRIEAGDYIGIYNEVGSVDLSSNAVLSSNNNGTINQGGAAVRIEGLSVTSDAGSLIETPAGNGSSEVLIQAMGATGTVVDLQGDIDAGIVVINSFAAGDIVIGGDITAQDDIIIHSAGALTIDGASILDADDLVALYSDGDMLIGGDVSGRYIRASLYGGEGGSGVDGSYLRVEGNLYADQTIELYNGVGDVEIGAGAQVVGNLGGYGYQTYQNHFVEITGENIITEAGSLITAGADAGPRAGDIYLHAYSYDGNPTLVDLSGDIDAETVIFNIEGGSFRQRAGNLLAINGITIDVDGYFQTDDGAYIHSDGGFFATSYGGMTANGDIDADGIHLTDHSAYDLVVGGDLISLEEIGISADDDIRLGAGANLVADSDNASGPDDFHYVDIHADGQVSSAAGSSIRVGDLGAPTGDVTLYAGGDDGGGYSAIDLSGDISALSLYLQAEIGSIRLRDGDITVVNDLDIAPPRSFIMDGPATVYTQGDFNVTAGESVSVAGTVTALGDIAIANNGDGGTTINGYLYAGADVFINNYGDGDIVLGGPTIVADFDGAAPSANQVFISNAGGAIVAPGGGSISVGAAGYEHGSITLYSGGSDGATSAIDLSGITLTADDVTLTTAVGSIRLGSSTVLDAGDDVTLDSGATIDTDSKAHIYAGDDVDFTADDGMDVAGSITAGGDVHLTVPAAPGPGPGPGQYGFSAGPGDIVVSGVTSADGSITVSNSQGDVYVSGQLLADADGIAPTYGYDHIRIHANYGQVVTGADSLLQVGPNGTPTGYVSLYGFGDDTANYSSVDLSGDITAASLTVLSGESIHLADGDIATTGSVFLGAYGYFFMDAPATITSGSDVNIVAAVGIQSEGDITAGGDVYFRLDPNAVFSGFVANAGDVVVGGNVTADGAITIVNEATGDIYIDGTAYLHADADGSAGAFDNIYIDSNGQVISAAGSSMVVGDVGATTGGVYIYASGADNASYSSVDLSGDIDADTLYVSTDGSIRLRDGDIVLSGDLFLGTYVDFLMDAPATIDAAGDVTIVAANSLRSYGDITSGGTIYLHLDPDAYFGSAFTAGPGDLVVGGNVTANGSVDIVNGGSGEVYVDGTAAILADADSTGGPDHIQITSDGQIISAAGSTLVVGAAGATTGDVTLTAAGTDSPGYSAIDLSGDIDADTLTLDADNGSIHLNDGTITVAEALDITNSFHIVMDTPAVINGASDVSMTAGLSLQVNGTVYSGGDIDLLVSGPNALDLTVGGDLTADGSITAENAGNGLLTIFDDGSLDAGSFVHLTSNGDMAIDGTVTSAGNVLAYSGSDLDVGGVIDAASGVSLNADANIHLSGDVDTDIGLLFADAGGDLIQYAGTLSTGDGDIYLHAADDLTLDGHSYSGGEFDTRSGGDTDIGGVVDSVGTATLVAQGDMDLSGEISSGDAVYAHAHGDLYQSGSIEAEGQVRLISTYDMTVNGQVTGDNVQLYVYGGEGGSNMYVDGQVTAAYNIIIRNDSDGYVRLGSEGVLLAGDGPAGYSAIEIYAGGQVITDAGSYMHVGQDGERTGFIVIHADGQDQEDYSAIDLSGDIDASSVSLIAYDGSVQVREGSVRADEDIEIYATEFFILGEDGLISGAEDRAVDLPKPTGVVVYAAYDLPPGVNIAASDVDIEGHIVSGDMIAIGAYNVSGGPVTVGGADPLNLGVGFTLSNAEFQNLSADSIVVLSGQGTGYASAGYDLHIADLTIDADNVNDIWFGSQEDIIVDGVVTPNGDGVDLHLGFTLAFTQEDDFAANTFLVGFIPDNILISGSLGSADNPLGSVTLIAQGDILMGSSEFLTAASGPDFDPTVDYPTPGDNHVFIATDVLQMAAMGDIIQQNTGLNGQFGGLIIGLPQIGQELIFVPDQIDGLTIGGTNGFVADFGAGPTSIDLFGQFVGPNGQTVGGFNAANVDNLLDPDLLVGDYFFNSCLFYGECSTDEDIPVFHDPAPPVQLDTEDLLSFFSGFPFAEPDDEDDDDQVEGEPVTGSGNEDLWTMKPTGVRP